MTILKNAQKTIQRHNESESKSEIPTQAGGDNTAGLKTQKNICAMSALVQVCNFSQVLEHENNEANDQTESPSKRPRVETNCNDDKESGSRDISNTPKRSVKQATVEKTNPKKSDTDADGDSGAGSKRKRDKTINTKKILSFEAYIGSLVDFKSKHNHCNVPKSDVENKKLANFVTRMRKEYRAYQDNRLEDCNHLSSERIKILEGVGFQWIPRKGEIHELPFRERMEMLKKFKAQTGHCNVPASYSEDKSLGKWVAMQRRGYNKYQESGEDALYGVNADRIKQLEDVGFKWVMQSGGQGCKTFEERLSDLRAFKKSHGHCNVPQKYESDQQLANFVAKMRLSHSRFKKHGKDPRHRINADRAKILEEMGFCWNLKVKRKEDRASGLIPKKAKAKMSPRKKNKAKGSEDDNAAGSPSGEDKVGRESSGDRINDLKGSEGKTNLHPGAPNLGASIPPASMFAAGTQNMLLPPVNSHFRPNFPSSGNPYHVMSVDTPYYQYHYNPSFPLSGYPYHAVSVDTRYYQYHYNPSLATSQGKNLETPVEKPPTKRRRTNPEKALSKPPRRKKMYSDYVGVTYNKTHAKYQACITHYRKQHYLGRYRLAVDAAKAYDDSAKLLKGENWKTNFESDNDYENAKAQEIEMIERQRMKTESNVSDAIGTQHEKNSQLVKQKLGLRMSLAHDTSFVAERMRSDRLEAVKKQAADHADQLKLNGVDLNKKSKSTRKKKGGDVNATGTEVVSNTLSLAFLHFLFWMCC